MKSLVFIGAGGHAKVVYDAAISAGFVPHFYIDQQVDAFFGLTCIEESAIEENSLCVVSVGGVTPQQLMKRQGIFDSMDAARFATIIHQSSVVSDSANIGSGTVVFANAVVNAAAKVGRNAIINTGAIIEHDVEVGDGSHICPGAIILGGASIGKCCLIGAGAIVLPNSQVDDHSVVKAGNRYPK